MTADGLQTSYQDVVTENAALRQRNADLEQQVTGFRQRIGELEAALKTALEHLEAARRARKRQAVLLRKDFRRDHPKRIPSGPAKKPGTRQRGGTNRTR